MDAVIRLRGPAAMRQLPASPGAAKAWLGPVGKAGD